MPEISVLTIAYNAEKTLKRTIESVLTQTFRDFEYIVIDHGSTDKTRNIIQAYETQDSRVRGVYLDENGINQGDMSYTQRLQIKHFKESDARWGVCLDADDCCEPEALEKMLAFAKQHHSDIVCCGSSFVSAKTGKEFSQRAVRSHALLRTRQEWSDALPIYHQFMRAYWGKLISLDLFRDPGFTMEEKNIMGDTGLMLAAFESAHTVGFCAELLHKWYLSTESTSQTMLTRSRINFNRYCYARALDFLKAKCGSVSSVNHEFLLVVYMNELIDSLRVLLSSPAPQAEKLALLQAMLLNPNTYELAAYPNFGTLLNNAPECTARRKSLFDAAKSWMLSLDEVPDTEAKHYCEMGIFSSAAAEDSGAWIQFKKMLAQFLLEQGRMEEADEQLRELGELLPDDEEIQNWMACRPYIRESGAVRSKIKPPVQ